MSVRHQNAYYSVCTFKVNKNIKQTKKKQISKIGQKRFSQVRSTIFDQFPIGVIGNVGEQLSDLIQFS